MTTAAAITAVTEEKYLRSGEVAAILRCRPRTITARCERGVYGGAVRHEGYWLIPESAIGAALTPRPQAPTDVPAARYAAGPLEPSEIGDQS